MRVEQINKYVTTNCIEIPMTDGRGSQGIGRSDKRPLPPRPRINKKKKKKKREIILLDTSYSTKLLTYPIANVCSKLYHEPFANIIVK